MMKNKLLFLISSLFIGLSASSQYCIPTYGTTCLSGGTNDIIENFWTTGGSQNISNLNTSCNMQPNNYLNTGLALIAQAGDVIGVNVQCATSGTIYQQGFAIWVDWNQDFDFDDAGEKVYGTPNSGPNVFTGTFTIPDGLECGDYRMRVRSKYASSGAQINPCDNQTYGEVEDYTITIDQCEPTICEGDIHQIDMTNGMPPNVTSYSWSPATNISDPTAGPIVDVFPTDTTTYTVTITSPDSVWTVDHIINVVHVIEPNAGLDDSLCFVNGQGYQLQGQLYNDGDFNWEYSEGPADAPGLPNAIFQPNNQTIDATTLTNYSGLYEYVLHESDTNNVCPDGTDTVTIFFSKETHTTTFTDPTCFEGTDGSISITSTGVVGGTQYSFNNGAYYSSNSDSLNLEAGVYDVISQNYLGCTASSQITITDPLEIMITVGPLPDSTVCENGSAVLYASAINGTTYDFHWNHTSNLNFEQTIYPINDTIVTVFAESELGCLSETLPISILLHDPITLSITENDTVCPGYDSQIIVEALGGFQGYNYVWEVNNTSYNSSTNTIDVNPNVESNYCVTVTDGCETTPKTICTRVIMREVPEPLFSTDLVEGCNPTEINFTNETVFNLAETQIDSINWLIDGVLFNTPTVTHLFENVGEYDIELEIFTQYNCHNSMTASEYISIHEIPVATFYVISNPTTIFNTEVDMINNTQGDNLTFQWLNTGAVPASSNAEAPTVVYPEGVAADYPVQLVVTNEFGCTDTTTDIVHVISDVLIYAPNTFTPDGDQINSTWRVYIDGIDFTDYHLLIFNRWGEIVWESYDAEAEWNGTYGSSNIVKDGTYVWSIITKDANTDKKYQFRGTVNIIK